MTTPTPLTAADHTSNALASLVDLNSNPTSTGTTQAVEALVHATLAQAAEQRTANLLHFADVVSDRVARAREVGQDIKTPDLLTRQSELLAEIRANLGVRDVVKPDTAPEPSTPLDLDRLELPPERVREIQDLPLGNRHYPHAGASRTIRIAHLEQIAGSTDADGVSDHDRTSARHELWLYAQDDANTNLAPARSARPSANAISRVVEAWRNPGRNPAYHERQRSHLRNNWPTLADALNRLDHEHA